MIIDESIFQETQNILTMIMGSFKILLYIISEESVKTEWINTSLIQKVPDQEFRKKFKVK